jgi:hypothetical protein
MSQRFCHGSHFADRPVRLSLVGGHFKENHHRAHVLKIDCFSRFYAHRLRVGAEKKLVFMVQNGRQVQHQLEDRCHSGLRGLDRYLLGEQVVRLNGRAKWES